MPATSETAWIGSFFSNFIAYAVLVGPAYFFIKYAKKNESFLSGSSIFSYIGRVFVFGAPKETEPELPLLVEKDKVEVTEEEKPILQRALHLIFCVAGLQISYLVWGVLQEQMMTQSYGKDEEGNDVYFTNSQFLVLMNRLLALVVAALAIHLTKPKETGVPYFKFGFPSISNTLSSWCQYEALKYISFPTQVLSKSSKVIPVMLMGKIVQQKTYPMYEYVCAVVMSVGFALFMFGRAEDASGDNKVTTMSGVILLAGYIAFDSFTSNYQDKLFKDYKMTSYQMMLGNNIFSTIFSVWALIQQGLLISCFVFLMEYPLFLWHCILLSICSATGQVFIFHTLSTYGALVFTIIMTTRQMISILLSAFFFEHLFTLMAWSGIAVVFASMFLRIYYQQTNKKKKGQASKPTKSEEPQQQQPQK